MRTCSFEWQGGGVYIWGKATLSNTSVYSNTAGSQGGGVFVSSNGVANFEGCNIHDNTAYSVRTCIFELSLNFHPSPP